VIKEKLGLLDNKPLASTEKKSLIEFKNELIKPEARADLMKASGQVGIF
jgi:hypothetical protein